MRDEKSASTAWKRRKVSHVHMHCHRLFCYCILIYRRAKDEKRNQESRKKTKTTEVLDEDKSRLEREARR